MRGTRTRSVMRGTHTRLASMRGCAILAHQAPSSGALEATLVTSLTVPERAAT